MAPGSKSAPPDPAATATRTYGSEGPGRSQDFPGYPTLAANILCFLASSQRLGCERPVRMFPKVGDHRASQAAVGADKQRLGIDNVSAKAGAQFKEVGAALGSVVANQSEECVPNPRPVKWTRSVGSRVPVSWLDSRRFRSPSSAELIKLLIAAVAWACRQCVSIVGSYRRPAGIQVGRTLSTISASNSRDFHFSGRVRTRQSFSQSPGGLLMPPTSAVAVAGQSRPAARPAEKALDSRAS